jgi:hypothetical protein
VFYTKAHEDVKQDAVQTGNKVYKTPVKTCAPSLIYDSGSTISLLSIKNGKLVF